MAEGVGRIIRGWNRFYSGYSADSLIATIGANIDLLSHLRSRDILSFTEDDHTVISKLFTDYLDALKRVDDGRKSPVSVAKALSLFAPGILPIWDSIIATSYGCVYVGTGIREYLTFCAKMKIFAENAQHCITSEDDRPLLKRIDEYNYSKYTKHWI